MASKTRPAATRARCSDCVAAGNGETSSKAASGTSASTASSAPLSEPACTGPIPSVTAPQLASPASAVVSAEADAGRARAPAGDATQPDVRRSDALELLVRHHRRPSNSGAPSTRSTTSAASAPRAVAWRASSRRASRPVSHGTAVAETTSATSSTRPAWGRNHHSAATVAPAHQDGDGEGLDHSQHDVLERVDVVDDARHEVTTAEGGQPGRRQRLEPRVHADAEVGQHAQGGVVADQPLAVAQEAT